MTPKSSVNIPKIADLARMQLSEEACAAMEKDITRIIEYIDVLNQVDVSNVEPTAHIAGLRNVMRADEIVDATIQEALLHQAPARIDDTLIKVPAVLPGEGMA